MNYFHASHYLLIQASICIKETYQSGVFGSSCIIVPHISSFQPRRNIHLLHAWSLDSSPFPHCIFFKAMYLCLLIKFIYGLWLFVFRILYCFPTFVPYKHLSIHHLFLVWPSACIWPPYIHHQTIYNGLDLWHVCLLWQLYYVFGRISRCIFKRPCIFNVLWNVMARAIFQIRQHKYLSFAISSYMTYQRNAWVCLYYYMIRWFQFGNLIPTSEFYIRSKESCLNA